MAKSKASIEEALLIADQIAKARAFSAFLLFAPFDRRKVVIEEGGPEGYAKALAAAEELNNAARAEGSLRHSIIYAIAPLGSFDVTPDLASAAGLIAS